MPWYADTLWCDGCGVEIFWTPVEKGKLSFCCQKCLVKESCDCEDLRDEYPSRTGAQASPAAQTEI